MEREVFLLARSEPRTDQHCYTDQATLLRRLVDKVNVKGKCVSPGILNNKIKSKHDNKTHCENLHQLSMYICPLYIFHSFIEST
jgi:hypothetical protein